LKTSRSGSTKTHGVRSRRSVWAAMAAKHTHGSGKSASFGMATLPSGVYGYGDAHWSGTRRWAPTATPANPSASASRPRATSSCAARRRATSSCGSAKCSACQYPVMTHPSIGGCGRAVAGERPGGARSRGDERLDGDAEAAVDVEELPGDVAGAVGQQEHGDG